MNRGLHRRVVETVRRSALIRSGDRLGLGVSGGADSVAMLQVFADLRSELGVALLVLHFNHQLRGAEADEDERFVCALAATIGLEFHSSRTDVAAEARRGKLNVEDAARRLRYAFFHDMAAAYALDRVAVAHTSDDQAETVLAHMLRGTGIAGLAGIYPVNGLIIRPMLQTSRQELREFLSQAGQSWREDASNQDTSRMRARIRHRLIPMLVHEFEPQVVRRLARLASHAREQQSLVRVLEDDAFSAQASIARPGVISVPVSGLLAPFSSRSTDPRHIAGDCASSAEANLALARRLVRRIVADIRGDRKQLSARHVQDVLDLARNSQSGAKIDLPGVCVERVFDRLVFDPADRHTVINSPRRSFEYELPRLDLEQSPFIVVEEIQRRYRLKLVDWPTGQRETGTSPGTLDYDRVRWPLVLRNWRPGDSYRPRGSRRVQKVKSLLLKSRVPRSARLSWPVLISAGRVVWVPGCPVADEFAPHTGTQKGLLIEEE